MSDLFKQHEQQLQVLAQSLDQLITEHGNQMTLETSQKLTHIRKDIQNYLQILTSALNQELQGTQSVMANDIHRLLAIHQSNIQQELKQGVATLEHQEKQMITTAFGEIKAISKSIQQTLDTMHWQKDSLSQMVAIQEENQAKIKELNKQTALTVYKLMAWGFGVIVPLFLGAGLWLWTAYLNQQLWSLQQQVIDMEVRYDEGAMKALKASEFTVYTEKSNPTSKGEPFTISYRYRYKPTTAEVSEDGTVSIRFY